MASVVVPVAVDRAWGHVALHRTWEALSVFGGAAGPYRIGLGPGEWLLGAPSWSPSAEHPSATRLATLPGVGRGRPEGRVTPFRLVVGLGQHVAIVVLVRQDHDPRGIAPVAHWLGREMEEWAGVVQRVAAEP